VQPAIATHLSQSTGVGALCGQHGMTALASTASSPDMDIATSCDITMSRASSIAGITISCAIASDGCAAIVSRDDGVKAIAAVTMTANT
jgi:hypothetical protein